MGTPPTGFQQRFVTFMASTWYLLVLAAAALFFVVLAVTTGTAIFVLLAVFGGVVLAMQAILHARSTDDERAITFSVGVDPRSARELALTLLDAMDPEAAPVSEADGPISIDLSRKGAALGVHMTVDVTPAGEGTRVDVTSRYRLRQPPSKLRTNDVVLGEFEREFTRLAPKTAT